MRGGEAPSPKSLPPLLFKERGTKGVRFNKSSKKIGILDKVVELLKG